MAQGLSRSVGDESAGMIWPGSAGVGLSGAAGWLARVPLIAWALLAVILVGGFDLWTRLPRLSADYGDLDDALRIVQVRELMAHGRWFDLTLARMGGADSLVSHWSRLIDLPLALSISFFSLFVPVLQAELIVRVLWPLLMLTALFVAVSRAADVSSDRLTALVALGLLMTSPSATSQFAIGRIDHHNVQNLAATAAILLLWLCPRLPHAGRWAGLIAGIGLAVGYEALPILLVATAAVSLWALLDRSIVAEVRSYLLWLAATLAVAFVATVPASRWGVMVCDVLAFNLVAMAVIGGGGVALALSLSDTWSTRTRWLLALGSGAAGVVTGFALEPGCLAGPLGQMLPELTDVWFVHVPEGRSWLYFLSTEPHGALAVAVLFTTAAAYLGHKLWRERRAADAFYLAVFLMSLPLGLRYMKYLPYSSLLAIPPMAMFIAGLPALRGLSAPTVRLAAFLALNQLALMMVVLQLTPLTYALVPSSSPPAPVAATSEPATAPSAAACYRRDSLVVLDNVAQGLVFAPIDLGAHILADTHHSVLAGPYHRIGAQILETHAVLQTARLDDAEQRLRRMHADYVLICPAIEKLLTPVAADPTTFDSRLRRGEALPFLQRVDLPAGSPFKLWRVTPAGGAAHGR